MWWFTDTGKWFTDSDKSIYLYLQFIYSYREMPKKCPFETQPINEKYISQIIIYNAKIKLVLHLL